MNYASLARDQLTNLGGNFRSLTASDRFANLRPIHDCMFNTIYANLVLDIRRISKPNGLGEIQSRVSYNLARYSSNYSIIFALLAIWALISNPLLLLVIIIAVGGMLGIGKLAGENLRIGPVDLSTSQLYTTLVCITVPLGFIASPISTVFWLVGANAFVILGHASLMEPPVESQFEEVGQSV